LGELEFVTGVEIGLEDFESACGAEISGFVCEEGERVAKGGIG